VESEEPAPHDGEAGGILKRLDRPRYIHYQTYPMGQSRKTGTMSYSYTDIGM